MRPSALLAVLFCALSFGLPAAAQTPRERLGRASVDLVEGRTPRARAIVLAGDGRLVAPLASVQDVSDLQVRYPDGRLDRLRVISTDPAWGVALLEGSAGHWPQGLELSAREPRSGGRLLWSPARGRVTEGTLARRRTFVGPGPSLLRDGYELSPAPPATTSGSPLLDAESGALVGCVISFGAASADAGVTSTPIGVPASVLRALRDRARDAGRPWLGLVARDLRPGEATAMAPQGIQVVEVTTEGPAHRAGVRAGPEPDVIVGVDEHPVRSLEDLGNALAGRRPGDTVVLRVMRRGSQVDLPLTLEALRPETERPMPVRF